MVAKCRFPTNNERLVSNWWLACAVAAALAGKPALSTRMWLPPNCSTKVVQKYTEPICSNPRQELGLRTRTELELRIQTPQCQNNICTAETCFRARSDQLAKKATMPEAKGP